MTQQLLSWIASVPNNAVFSFGQNACYRIEGTLEFSGRTGLTFEGNGSTFRSFNAPADQRAIWRVVGSTGITFHNMTIDGSYASGGTFNASLQHAHAIDLRGTNATVANVNMSDVAGDCVYFGLGYDGATRSSGSVHDSNCVRTGRNAVSVTAGDNIVVQHVTTGSIGFTAFDVEPNMLPGFGSKGVTFDSNTIGSYYLYAYAIVSNAPISNQTFSNNTVTGRGLRIGVVNPSSTTLRPQGVTITGNSSNTSQWSPAMEFHNVDTLAVTGNTVPIGGGALATVDGSCYVDVSGNTIPGGTQQDTVSNTPTTC